MRRRGALALPLPYMPAGEADGRAHVMADGAARASTVLTLSHWPRTPTPIALRADLSAQSAFALLDSLGRGERWPAAAAATADHFDQDGLMTLYPLVDPAGASDRRELVVQVAAAGDFARCASRAASQVCFALAAWTDPERSPLGSMLDRSPDPGFDGTLHREVLPRLAELLDHPDRFKGLWDDEDAFLTDSFDALRSGSVTIEEVPGIDLAVVDVGSLPLRQASEFARHRMTRFHPMAVHEATACTRVLLLGQGDYELRFRYETWVRLETRRPPPRPDLTKLVERLESADTVGTAWSHDAAPAIISRVCSAGPSALSPAQVRAAVEDFLREFAAAGSPPAWDPYAA
jgi:hypothetical protein